MRIGILEYNSQSGVTENTAYVSRGGAFLGWDDLSIRTTPSAYDAIYLTAQPEHTAVFDIELPSPLTGRHLEEALRSELERLVPLTPDRYCCCRRRLRRDNRRYRLVVTRLDAALDVIGRAAAEGFVCDHLLPVQLLDGVPEDAAEEPGGGSEPTAKLLAYLKHDPHCRNLRFAADLVPRAMRPVRNKALRRVHKTLLGVGAVLLAALLLSRFEHFYSEYSALREELAELAGDKRRVEAFSQELVRHGELAQRISDARIGNASALPILADLNERLPEHMYLPVFNQTGDLFELTIVSDCDDLSLPRILLGSKLYQSDLRKNVQPDGQETIFNVTLRSTAP